MSALLNHAHIRAYVRMHIRTHYIYLKNKCYRAIADCSDVFHSIEKE